MNPGHRRPHDWTESPLTRRAHVCATALLVLLLGSMLAAGEQGAASEYQVKAAFLLNFARFAQWPADSFASPSAPIVFGIFGEDPFGAMLTDTVRSKTVGGHRLVVRRVDDVTQVAGCHLLFIGAGERSRLGRVIATPHRGVLTVGETERFAERGGVIQLTLADRRVGFIINTDAAKRAGVGLSAKLLSLATIVRDSGPEERR